MSGKPTIARQHRRAEVSRGDGEARDIPRVIDDAAATVPAPAGEAR